MWTLRLVILSSVLAFAVALGPGLADDRLPVPPRPALDKADAAVKDLFKADYARTKPADRLALAAKLHEYAGQSKDDPAARYVLLREARDLAAKAGDGIGAMRAADELTATFTLKPGEAHLAAVDPLVAASTTVGLARATADALVSAAEEVRAAGEWDAALTLLKGADAAARKSSSFPLANAVRTKIKDTELLRAEAEKVKDRFAALKDKPDDPDANLAVGRFLLLRQDWEAAVAHLAKGSDDRLKEAAGKDRAAATGDTEDEVAAADAWYDLAAAADPTLKPAFQIRAAHWYARAFPDLTGLGKTRVEKRLAELQPVVDARADRSRMWGTVRRGVLEKKLKKWDIVGGAFAQKTFEEVPPAGALLIGFHYTTISGGRFPGVVQPIYKTAHGEVLGTAYGTPEKGAKLLTVKAKTGYAVGAIYTRGGGGFDAFKPIFMRITDTSLDTRDRYDGPHVGGMGGGEGTLGGDGNFIVGLHGKVNDKGKMEAMSPVSLTVNDLVRPRPKGKRPKKP